MSNLYFISDHHLGHANILKHEPKYRPFDNIDDHNEWIIEQHNRICTKNDTIWFLGDVANKLEHLALVDRMHGTKNLILGNHDNLRYSEYKKHFRKVLSMRKSGSGEHTKWFTHIPVHPAELEYRVKWNFHGHIHARNLIDDPRYVNVCIEQSAATPLTIDQWMALHRNKREANK